ncbi:regulator of G-protein signaling 4 [Aplochiton taeniatus]
MCRGLAALPATCLKSAKDIKHKIGFLLQKPDQPPDQQQQIKDKAPGAKRVPLPAEVEKWKESFNNLMNSEDGRAVFTSFLKSEFSQENIEFWSACEDYKKTPLNKMAAKAREIYDQYVKADSPNEVNLDATSRAETRESLDVAGLSCFEEAQAKIFTLMEKDSYRRFLCSKMLQDLSPSAAESTPGALEKKGTNPSCVENRKRLTGGA